MGILNGIGVYFAVGVVAIGLLDLITKRIRSRLFSSSQEAKDRMTISGTAVGTKEAIVLTIGALWLFWPLVICSALIGGKSGKKG